VHRALLQDIRYALRLGKRNTGVTLFAILPLGLAIGSTIAIFSVMYALLRPLPVYQPERLVEVAHTRGVNMHPYAMWAQVRDKQNIFSDVLSGIFAYYAWEDSLDLVDRGDRQSVGALFVSGEAFHVLGVPAVLGRTLEFVDDHPGVPPVCMISDGLWKRQYGRAPSVLNRTVTLNNQTFQIIGIAPRWFFGLERGTKADIFLPLETRRLFANQRFPGVSRCRHWKQAMPSLLSLG
jgi:putative ABC transport system permease protein